jgi:hypothetical protein
MRMRRRAKEALAYGASNQVLIKVLGFPRAPGACPERSRRVPCGLRFSQARNQNCPDFTADFGNAAKRQRAL